MIPFKPLWIGLLFLAPTVSSFAPVPRPHRSSVGLFAGIELGDALLPVSLYVAAVVGSVSATTPEFFEKLKGINTTDEEVVELETVVQEMEEAREIEGEQAMKVVTQEIVEELEAEEEEEAEEVEVEEEVEEDEVEVVEIVQEATPAPVASVVPTSPVASVTPKTISQMKREVASTLEGEREKEERLRLAAAKREIEEERAARILEETDVEAEEGSTAVIAEVEETNGVSEAKSKRLRRKLFRVLKKSVAPWRKWKNID